MLSLSSWNRFTSKAVGDLGGTGNKAVLCRHRRAVKTSVKGDSTLYRAGPAPWVWYEIRECFDQAPQIEAAVPTYTLHGVSSATEPFFASVGCNSANKAAVTPAPTDTLRIETYRSATTASCAGVGRNCSNGGPVASAADVAAAATPSASYPAYSPSPVVWLPRDERYLSIVASFARDHQSRRNMYHMLPHLRLI